MKKYRQKLLELWKKRGPTYKGYNKAIIERKIHNTLTNKLMIESVVGITSLLGDIPYALIGGHAVTIHGSPRTTDDVDILTTPEYVDDIVEKLGLQVSSPLTIGGVAATTPSGIEIDVVSPDMPWLEEAIKNAEQSEYGKVVSKPYLILTKIWASRGVQDDSDIIKILQQMNEEEQAFAVNLVEQYFPNMVEDIEQMIEIAKLGFEL